MPKNLEKYREIIIESCKNSLSMCEACAKTNLHFNTFKRYAILLGVYKTNIPGKGIKKNMPDSHRINLREILEGKHPQYQTYKLKLRLIKENIFEDKCFECGLTEWNGKPLPLELDHIDGNSHNHVLSNLRILCPNCHSQTDTYRATNLLNKH